jgi:hypothetical protein
MFLFNKLIDIFKLIHKFIYSRDNNIITPYTFDVLSNEIYYTLDNTYNKLETSYYNTVMYSQLEQIWHIEKKSLILCLACIVHVLNH